MNGNHQPLQEQHSIAERVARLETAIHYQGQAISRLQEGMGADFVRTDGGFVRVDMGFARMSAEFARMHEQLLKIRTTDFRILLSICLTTALGTMSLIVKIYGLL